MKKHGNGLIIGDLHAPYHHPAALDWLSDVARRVRPAYVVCIGDEIDAYAFSHFTRNPAMPSAREEMDRALTFLRSLYTLFPRVRVCHSNHTYRPYARALEAGLDDRFLRPIRAVLGAPRGWEWADRWDINGVLYIHGDGFSGEHAHTSAALQNRASTWIGHVHSLHAVQWLHGRSDAIFGAATGCLIDDTSLAFAYAKHSAKRPALGCGVMMDYCPHLIPFTGR